MTNSNRIEFIRISFLSYTLTDALIIIIGIMTRDIVDYFNLPVSNMSNTFTFLNIGILIFIFFSAWLMEIIPLKTRLRFSFFLMVLAVTGLMFGHNLALLSAAMFILGVVSGITISIDTFLVTRMYKGRQRGSHLLSTDSSFGMVEMIFPIVVAFLPAHNIEWYWIYACIRLVYVVIFILTFGCRFPTLDKYMSETDIPVEKEKQGIGTLFLSVVALCYTLGQLGFISWVPEYARGLDMNLNGAGMLVSSFWMSCMVGMWALSFILHFFDSQHILIILIGLAVTLMYVFNTETPVHMVWSILALGFSPGVVYTATITLDSQQTKAPLPKLANFVLTCGTISTMLAFVVTGSIVEHSSPQAVLLTVNSLYAVVSVMYFLLGFISYHRQCGTLTSH